MLLLNGREISVNSFPDNATHFAFDFDGWRTFVNWRHLTPVIQWRYEADNEVFILVCLKKHLAEMGYKHVILDMYYIPHARMDRVKTVNDVFTLKYFCEIINSLNFDAINVFDPHSNVSCALLNNLNVHPIEEYIKEVITKIGKENLILFFPDEGAMKRYVDLSKTFNIPFVFGIKNRDWKTGKITNLTVAGDTSMITGKNVLIIDDICSRGGTFFYASKELNKYQPNEIYLYVSHCENTIYDGELYHSGLIKTIYTTNSLLKQKEDDMLIKIIELNNKNDS